jgi:uncharacterized protein YcnI
MTRRRPSARAAAALALMLLLLLLAPALAGAHAVVFPKRSTPGAYEKYVLRVPNEKGVATTRVEIRFPADVRVVSFADVPGWTLETVTDSAGKVVGAVWTGTLPPKRFVELPFVAVNPKAEARLVWPAFQTYADGERVAWTGAEDAKTPASSTRIAPEDDEGAGESGGSPLALWLSAAALVLALVGLGVALRPK